MPNVSFDIFFDKDFINVTATRGQTAPKAKPEWKVRSVPKLPPKPAPEPQPGHARPPPRQKLTSLRQPQQPHKSSQEGEKVAQDTEDQGSQAEEKPRQVGLERHVIMATQWVIGKISDAIAPTISNSVASAGSFAGGAVNAVGGSINSVGESINGTVRRYGDGVKDYGNGLLDWTSADSTRAATASNPLGLSAGATGGKRQVTSGSFYRAPAANPSKTLTTTSKTAAPQKKTAAGTPKKALPSTATKKAPAQPLKPVQNNARKTVHPNPGAIPKKPAGNGAAKAPASARKPVGGKPSMAGAPKPTTAAKTGAAGNYSSAASNPLGLKF